jgi:F-type H+-transporting ATPase subunit gamma
MPSIKQINKKIKSLVNTRKITRAMKMIAATKLRKAQTAFNASEPYAKSLSGIMSKIAAGRPVDHPLFRARDQVRTVHVIVLTSDRGLCGAFNNNLIKKAHAFVTETRQAGQAVVMSFIGKRGHEFFKKRGAQVRQYYQGLLNKPDYGAAAKIGDACIGEFLSGQADEVHLFFNEFKSAISQVPTGQRILPMVQSPAQATAAETPHLFEPTLSEITGDLVARSFKLAIFRSILNSAIAEHAARMNAMDSATNNSEDLIDKYTLQRNKARQAAITKELVEIVSGAESM